MICALLAMSVAVGTLQAQEETFSLNVHAYEWSTNHQTMTFSWPGYADTSCRGNTCTTTYTPPIHRDYDAQYPEVYILADTATRRLVLTCTRYWGGSKCFALDPDVYTARWKKGYLEVQVFGKKNKEEWIKYAVQQESVITKQAPPKPEPSKPTVQTAAPSIDAPAALDAASEFPKRWKCMQNGEIHVLRFHGDYIYAEQILTEADAKTGLYFLYEFKKSGDKYVGTFKGRVIDGSNSCPVTFDAELTSVTKERIEGRMSLPQMTSKIDWNTCRWSTTYSWDEFSWIPVK